MNTSATPVQLFVQSGCSSCLRAKEFLTTNLAPGSFEIRNISTDPDALGALDARGIRTVPVVFRGDAYAYAQDVTVVAQFLGISRQHSALAPAVLLERYDQALAVASALTAQIPAEVFARRAIESRDRSAGMLAHHIPDIADRFLAGVGTGRWEKAAATMPPGIETVDDVLAYGAGVRERLATLAATVAPSLDFAGTLVRTYYGEPTAHYLLERSTWHSIQHTRQLHDLLDRHGVVPAAELDAAVTSGIPLPTGIWE